MLVEGETAKVDVGGLAVVVAGYHEAETGEGAVGQRVVAEGLGKVGIVLRGAEEAVVHGTECLQTGKGIEIVVAAGELLEIGGVGGLGVGLASVGVGHTAFLPHGGTLEGRAGGIAVGNGVDGRGAAHGGEEGGGKGADGTLDRVGQCDAGMCQQETVEGVDGVLGAGAAVIFVELAGTKCRGHLVAAAKGIHEGGAFHLPHGGGMAADIVQRLLVERLVLLTDKGEGDALTDKLLQVAVAATVLQPLGVEGFSPREVLVGQRKVELRAVGTGVEARQVDEVGNVVGVFDILVADVPSPL